jgi:beta-N-acetylhexosaminidase
VGRTGGHTPRHLRDVPDAARPSPAGLRWPLPLLAVGLLAGVAGLTVLRPGGPAGGAGPTTTVALAAESGPIQICTRASLEDRAALVLVLGLPGVTDADDPLIDELAAVGVGAVMLRDDNLTDEEQARELVTGLRDRLGQGLLVAVDDEGGRVSSLGALDQDVTSARRLGQRGEDAAWAAGAELGRLAASIGIDWVFAPVADLDDGPASGVIGDRSFSGDPAEAAVMAGAFARGLRSAGVAATVKHFPGHGGVGDPHLGTTVDDAPLDVLLAEDMVPFDALIGEGAEAVMVGHVVYPQIWPHVPASLAPGAYELLRAQGFEGVAITDALGMAAIHSQFRFDVAPAMALAAGADAVLVTQGTEVRTLHDGVVAAVREGRLDEARLDEAVRRVLSLRGESVEGTVCPT